MLKKLFVTAAAAAAVSVPLAGAAWADPGDPSGNGVGQGGIPKVVGQIDDDLGTNINPPDEPLTPGAVFNNAKDAAPKGTNTPDAYGGALDDFFGTNAFKPTPPGLGVKSATPGCSNGHGVDGTAIGQPGNICSAP
jgi:hypothetical protein